VRHEVYLQGSYKNSTNIRGDSDVDIVVQLNSTFRSDTSALPLEEGTAYSLAFDDATYDWFAFRRDVLEALRNYYGSALVSEGNKAIKLAAGSGRLPGDIVVCIQYRRYLRFQSVYDSEYVEGMTFYVPSELRWVINYPKVHHDNGVDKNAQRSTTGWYKPTVRMFKNARNHSDAGAAPSYFIECLLYNVPNAEFGTSFWDTFCDVVNWLEAADLNKFVCQNRQQWLFGATPEQWSIPDARLFVQAMMALWNGWGR